MELKVEIPDDSFNTYRKQKINNSCSPSTSCHLPKEHDFIDCTKFDFHDDENWLYKSSTRLKTNLREWLYSSDTDSKPSSKLSSKNIDTRTFTRPKKRFTRPSIEKYNEELYGSEVKELTDSGIQLNGWTVDETPSKPLHFDLDQPSSSVYFDNILANAPMMDSFQNMSPPSLVNSMCSSTFANLMESSFIKNDPVLREIRDTDFTGSILQQEGEPMFHSITESFSSLNSDIPENFLKKVSFTEDDSILKITESQADMTVILNATFAKENTMVCDDTIIVNNFEDLSESEVADTEDLNTTYVHLSRAPNKDTDRRLLTNNTFQRRKSPRLSTANNEQARTQGLNSTVTIEPNKNNALETTKRLLDRRPSPSYDLNRLSYLVDKNDSLNSSFNENAKRNSFGSTDSGENLDYMSISSASSRSSRMQSVDELSDIIDAPERTLQHVMSTPRANAAVLWPNHEISPITDRNSDPEMSSTEQTVKQNSIRKQKSVGHINQKMPSPKSFNTLTRLGARGAIRGSQPNLKLNETRTYGPPKSTNLNSMGHALKGSYTSLKPTNPNLPVAPPPLDTTHTLTKNSTVVAQVAPLPRESKSEDAQFAKPQPLRSALPRPATGIPRPVSRIPGPRKVRPVSMSAEQQGRY